MTNFIQSNQIVTLPYANTTISVADSGKILLTPQTAGGVNVVYTLPTLQAGLHYRFINGAPNALNGTVEIVGTVGSLFGSVITGPTDGVSFNDIDGDNNIFFDLPSLKGDFIDVTSDGTHWFIHCVSRVAGGIV